MKVVCLLPGLFLAQMIICTSDPDEVYYLPRREKDPVLLLGNVTGVTGATGDPEYGVLYVCVNDSIVEYTVNYESLGVVGEGETVYSGGAPTAPTLDVWGNLYFLDSMLNTVSVIYTSQANHTVTHLYSSTPSVSAPSALALDDFFDYLYWTNGSPVSNLSTHRALIDPTSSGYGISQTWAGYQGAGVDGLAITQDWVYISSLGQVYRAYKRNPKEWKTVKNIEGQLKVLAAREDEVFFLDLDTGDVKSEGKNHKKDDENDWKQWGVRSISVIIQRNLSAFLTFTSLILLILA